MRARQWLSEVFQHWQQWGRRARRAAGGLGAACRRLADRLAYRPREVVVVGLLAGGLCGGLGVERWRAGYPATAERLEAEPPRLATGVVAPPPARRPRPSALRCEAPPGGGAQPDRPAESATLARRLDLNRATPGELARLAGISWGLAARIVAARDAFESAGRAASPPVRGRFAGFRHGSPRAAARPVEPDSPPADPADPAPLEGSSDTPPQ